MLAAVQAAGCSPRHPRRAPIARGAPTARSVLGTRQSRVLTGAGCSGRPGVTAIGSRGSAPLRSPSLRSPPRSAPRHLPAAPRPRGSRRSRGHWAPSPGRPRPRAPPPERSARQPQGRGAGMLLLSRPAASPGRLGRFGGERTGRNLRERLRETGP